MQKNDERKACFSVLFFFCSIIFPVGALAGGWAGKDLETGAAAALATFGFFFLLSGLLILFIKNPPGWVTFFPLLFGYIYNLLPDIILGPIDDVSAFMIGALLTFFLWRKRQPQTPAWIIILFVIVALYSLAGMFIPGPVDEFIVGGIGISIASYFGYYLPNKGHVENY